MTLRYIFNYICKGSRYDQVCVGMFATLLCRTYRIRHCVWHAFSFQW